MTQRAQMPEGRPRDVLNRRIVSRDIQEIRKATLERPAGISQNRPDGMSQGRSKLPNRIPTYAGDPSFGVLLYIPISSWWDVRWMSHRRPMRTWARISDSARHPLWGLHPKFSSAPPPPPLPTLFFFPKKNFYFYYRIALFPPYLIYLNHYGYYYNVFSYYIL